MLGLIDFFGHSSKRSIVLAALVGVNITTGISEYSFSAPITPGTYLLPVTNVSPIVNGMVVAELTFSVMG